MKKIFLVTTIIVLMSSISFAQGGPRWEEREWQRGAQQREYEREERIKEQERRIKDLEWKMKEQKIHQENERFRDQWKDK